MAESSAVVYISSVNNFATIAEIYFFLRGCFWRILYSRGAEYCDEYGCLSV